MQGAGVIGDHHIRGLEQRCKLLKRRSADEISPRAAKLDDHLFGHRGFVRRSDEERRSPERVLRSTRKRREVRW
jgi:hypothetical protein